MITPEKIEELEHRIGFKKSRKNREFPYNLLGAGAGLLLVAVTASIWDKASNFINDIYVMVPARAMLEDKEHYYRAPKKVFPLEMTLNGALGWGPGKGWIEVMDYSTSRRVGWMKIGDVIDDVIVEPKSGKGMSWCSNFPGLTLVNPQKEPEICYVNSSLLQKAKGQ